MAMVDEREWRWFGNAAHFICGRWCRFHMATQVGPWLVSTVGEYVHPRHSGGSEATEEKWLEKHWPGENIGCDRKYETMVFRAGDPCAADECRCGIPTIASEELAMYPANIAGDATRNHMQACREWAAKARR